VNDWKTRKHRYENRTRFGKRKRMEIFSPVGANPPGKRK
jgi:hypothetical protein